MIRPDGLQRGLVGDIITRFEQKGFKLVAMKLIHPELSLIEEHYSDLLGKWYYPRLVKYASSGPVVGMVWEGTDVVKTGRKMLGATMPEDAQPGSVRGDFTVNVPKTIIHGSDSIESAEREIALWFKEKELINWKSHLNPWIYE